MEVFAFVKKQKCKVCSSDLETQSTITKFKEDSFYIFTAHCKEEDHYWFYSSFYKIEKIRVEVEHIQLIDDDIVYKIDVDHIFSSSRSPSIIRTIVDGEKEITDTVYLLSINLPFGKKAILKKVEHIFLLK